MQMLDVDCYLYYLFIFTVFSVDSIEVWAIVVIPSHLS